MLTSRLGLKAPLQMPTPSASILHVTPLPRAHGPYAPSASLLVTAKIGPERRANLLAPAPYWLVPTNRLSLRREKYAGGTCTQLPAVTMVRPPKSWSVMALFRNR